MKVLLAIDSSKRSHIVETAVALPWPAHTEFAVISVVDMRQYEGLPALIEDAKHQAQSNVKAALDVFVKAGMPVNSQTPEGPPKTAITEYAKQWKADLIMVGSHGSSAVTRFLLGSVAQSVLRTAPCSVEIVRHQPPKPMQGLKILIATDGSPSAMKAVKETANRPWPSHSEIRILSAVQLLTADVPSLPSELRSPTPNLLDEINNIARKRAEDAVAAARETLTATGAQVSSETPLGDARAVILDQAKEWNADLIVLGSRGRHGVDHLLMGSIAESVAAYAHCSVEVVR